MNKQKRLTVKVSSLEESLERFKNVWDRTEQGEKFDTPLQTLSFENSSMLMKTLSPKRLELLQKLHTLGPISIRELSKKLERDYSNVHEDIKLLSQAELVLEDKSGKYFVPWTSIVTEISLCTEKPVRHTHAYDTSMRRIAHG